jgi:hypothetical protein
MTKENILEMIAVCEKNDFSNYIFEFNNIYGFKTEKECEDYIILRKEQQCILETTINENFKTLKSKKVKFIEFPSVEQTNLHNEKQNKREKDMWEKWGNTIWGKKIK